MSAFLRRNWRTLLGGAGRSFRYFCAASAAMVPSATAVVICRKRFTRMSPAANKPGTVVAMASSVST